MNARALLHHVRALLDPLRHALAARLAGRRAAAEPRIHRQDPIDGRHETAVDAFWGEKTVSANPYITRWGSKRQLEWRFERYPLFRELSGLWGDHSGETVLDYGCGPGNDLVGLSLYSNPDKVIGVDVSEKALQLAARRLTLHAIDRARVQLIQVCDGDPRIPLPDDAVDHVNCQGVLQHTSDPASLLGELARVLKPGGTGSVMVYNRDSIWYHLCVPYVKMILEGMFVGLDIDTAFARSTDGQSCPISRAWSAEQFIAMCADAGLVAEYCGGYPDFVELESLRRHRTAALDDERLDIHHRLFLRELTIDPDRLPMYRCFHAGIGGVYRLAAQNG